MDENSDAKSDNAIEQRPDEIGGFQNGCRDNGLDIARVEISQKYKPRTAALPLQNSGFQ
jgi:hypothetical protein